MRQWVAFGVALSAHIRADPALLESATTSAARWIVEGSAHVPRSLHDWQFLCAPGDVDSVLLVLETMSEYADVMRVSHPLVGILTMAAWPRSALARGDEPVPQMPHAVWDEIARHVGTPSRCWCTRRAGPDAVAGERVDVA